MHGHGPTPVERAHRAAPPDVHERRWLILGVLSLSLLITALDHTIVNVALPSIQGDLDATTGELQWIVDAYTIVFAGLVLTAGVLGDRFGRKGALQVGLAVFFLGSVAAGMADTATAVIGARALMGVGGALVMPATLSILTNVFSDPHERAKAIGVWAGVAGVGVALGPITGGYLLEHFSWSSVFWVNVPVLALAMLAGRFVVPRSTATERRRLDIVGSALSVAALSALVYAVIEAPDAGWASARSVAWFTGAAALAAAFVAWERRRTQPMLEIRLFRNPRFSAASLSITLVFFAMTGTVFLVTQHLQLVLGYSALEAGFGVLPAAVALFVASPVGPRVAMRIGTRATIAGGLVIAAGGLASSAVLANTSDYLPVGIGLTLLGLGIGLAMSPATDSIMSSVPADQAGVGSGVNDTTREVGAALGVAVVGSVASSAYRNDIGRTLDDLAMPVDEAHHVSDSLGAALQAAPGLDPVEAQQLVSAAFESFVTGMQAGLWVASGVGLLGAVVAGAFLPRRSTYVHPEPETAATVVDDVSAPAPVPSPAALHGGLTR